MLATARAVTGPERTTALLYLRSSAYCVLKILLPVSAGDRVIGELRSNICDTVISAFAPTQHTRGPGNSASSKDWLHSSNTCASTGPFAGCEVGTDYDTS